jgi:hypothetical protein
VQIYKTKTGELFYLSSQKKAILSLTLPSPKERVQKSKVKVLSFGEDLGEVCIIKKKAICLY